MRKFASLLLFFVFTLASAAQQKLTPPQAITDPLQITSASRDILSIVLDKLFATRGLLGADWSPDGKIIAF